MLFKRILAFLIDYIFIALLYNFLNLNKFTHIAKFKYFENEFNIFIGIQFTMLLFYYFIFDFFKNNSIGKKIVSINLIFKKDVKLKQRFFRTTCKMLSYLLLPFTLLYFYKNKIFYHDKIFSSLHE